MLKSIEQEWQGFSDMVFCNTQPTDVQVVEMKKAFFAGAWSIINAAKEIGEPHVSEDDGVAWFEARQAECDEFQKQLYE